MAIPNVSSALRGWTKKRQVTIIIQTVVDHEVVEQAQPAVTMNVNVQPMPAQQIDRKPEEQREWKWWSLWIQFGSLLKPDDKIIIDGITYRVEKVSNWLSGGYQQLEAVEDYI